ncbi:hypothetical protein MPTK1_4g10300 [Marchantia polymorpha subsp. ruderalis]|uniref:Uncharacterized protein n=2 Tax=Marchantia polymorpha TaxID=3197 RepID=A0AAF6B8E8_MARPO|nr:hypothetical protein MARPO_0011s0017 [Marchantia polymorpha]BBN08282.1 hypothetical protein Mp_4g10300 [Marchantia polymorpha subsp. ruderalis]|eukprot:PTQ46318.1 hypothetical protein MARPO_0011s0017 [Marchantia polymorpha]
MTAPVTDASRILKCSSGFSADDVCARKDDEQNLGIARLYLSVAYLVQNRISVRGQGMQRSCASMSTLFRRHA